MKLRTLCTALLIFPAIAMAFGVNTKNGNFYITYLDVNQTANQHELGVNRTYNSKATEIGWFGFGWGSEFETRLRVMPDNSVVVHEIGAGQENYYAPKDEGSLQAGVDRIVAGAIERDKLEPDEALKLRNDLLRDESLRRKKVAELDIQTQLPVNGVARSSFCDVVTRINDEYKRTHCDEVIDYFDLSGRLIRKEDGDYKVTLHYAGKYPDRIEDSLGQKLYLKWTAAGHVAEARSGNAAPTVVYYRYDEKGNLLMANTMGGLVYRYEYDNNHNMTRIVYIDDTHMDMQYNKDSLITSLTRTDGSKTTYSYRTDPKNSSHYWTTTTWIAASGEQSSREEEFLLGSDAAGVEHLAGLTRTQGQRKQDVVMDDKGRIKYVKKPDGGFAEYFYHPTLNKVSAVMTDEVSTIFTYDEQGNMIRAYNSQDQLIKLDYDSKKHVSRMLETNKTDHTRRELTFKYNALGKPTRIKMSGRGQIDVEYDKQGEISKVGSKQGAKMALEVTNAFQILLNVVKVAGVDLGM